MTATVESRDTEKSSEKIGDLNISFIKTAIECIVPTNSLR
jgi:hypothetical protein